MFLVSAAQIVRISIHKAWNRARDNIRSHSHIECTTRSATVKQNKRALSTRAVLRHRCVCYILLCLVLSNKHWTNKRQNVHLESYISRVHFARKHLHFCLNNGKFRIDLAFPWSWFTNSNTFEAYTDVSVNCCAIYIFELFVTRNFRIKRISSCDHILSIQSVDEINEI